MDPFRYHDTNESSRISRSAPAERQPFTHGKRLILSRQHSLDSNLSCRPILPVPLVLPEIPGQYSEIRNSTDDHHIRTKVRCAGPGTHVITSIVQSRPILCSPRAIRGPINGGSVDGDSVASSVNEPYFTSDGSNFSFSNQRGDSMASSVSERSSFADGSNCSFPFQRGDSMAGSVSERSSVADGSNFSFPIQRGDSIASSVSERFSFADGIRPCSLCKKNGERPKVYNSHQLHCFVNGRRVVECPILRSVRCQICDATGDDAHTITHCPYSANRLPVALLLKNTPRQCNGSLRKRPV